MIKIIWFIPRPERDIEDAEALYQGQHVRRGMRQENLRAFRINRGLYPQPSRIADITGSSEAASFRFSEGYWDSFEEIEECYRSPHGLAALADGMLNAVARIPRGPQPVFFAEEQDFPTGSRLSFDIFRGRYDAPQPVKLFLFVRLRQGAESDFDADYVRLAATIGEADGLGPHVLSRRVDRVLHIGKASQWPPAGATIFDRVSECYFPAVPHLEAFLASRAFDDLLDLATRFGEDVLPVIAEPQEVFFTTTGSQAIPDGLRALYD